MECQTVGSLSYEELKLYTNDFSEDNFIGNFQFGKVYRGYIGAHEVTVKKWESPRIYTFVPGDNERRIQEEILLHQCSKLRSHPNVVNLVGYCSEDEEHLGVVYELKPLDSVYNLVLKDSFTWLQRVKVIIRFACLLEYMHAEDPPNVPYLVRNIDAAHIMLDQDCNPKLFDFGMISGGIFPDLRFLPYQFVIGCYGYIDVASAMSGSWSDKVDVFAFGTLMLMLISKRVFAPEDRFNHDVHFVHEWANDVYKPKKSAMGKVLPKCSLVHKSLQKTPGFYSSDGLKITKLAMRCVEYYIDGRPKMKQLVKHLLNLRVVRRHADFLGIDQSLLKEN